MMQTNESHDLTRWVDDFTQDLFSWALHKTSDEELARDLVQDTFVVAAEKLASFRGDSSPKTFLFSILNHKIIDVYRKKIHQPVHMDDQTISTFFNEDGDWHEKNKPREWHKDETSLLDDENFQSVLRNCISDLPEKWNVCLTSKYLMEKNPEDICQDLGITTTNYWQMTHRAKLQLRECIEKNWFEN